MTRLGHGWGAILGRCRHERTICLVLIQARGAKRSFVYSRKFGLCVLECMISYREYWRSLLASYSLSAHIRSSSAPLCVPVENIPINLMRRIIGSTFTWTILFTQQIYYEVGRRFAKEWRDMPLAKPLTHFETRLSPANRVHFKYRWDVLQHRDTGHRSAPFASFSRSRRSNLCTYRKLSRFWRTRNRKGWRKKCVNLKRFHRYHVTMKRNE